MTFIQSLRKLARHISICVIRKINVSKLSSSPLHGVRARERARAFASRSANVDISYYGTRVTTNYPRRVESRRQNTEADVRNLRKWVTTTRIRQQSPVSRYRFIPTCNHRPANRVHRVPRAYAWRGRFVPTTTLEPRARARSVYSRVVRALLLRLFP